MAASSGKTCVYNPDGTIALLEEAGAASAASGAAALQPPGGPHAGAAPHYGAHAFPAPIVKCPRCQTMLHAPPGAELFDCPCGQRLAAPPPQVIHPPSFGPQVIISSSAPMSYFDSMNVNYALSGLGFMGGGGGGVVIHGLPQYSTAGPVHAPPHGGHAAVGAPPGLYGGASVKGGASSKGGAAPAPDASAPTVIACARCRVTFFAPAGTELCDTCRSRSAGAEPAARAEAAPHYDDRHQRVGYMATPHSGAGQKPPKSV